MKKYNINLDKLHSSKQSLKDLKLLNFGIFLLLNKLLCSPEKLLLLFTFTFTF